MKTILSLTSYKKRFDTLHICLESLFRQIYMPDEIVLYVNESLNQLPDLIVKFISMGLHIEKVDQDLGPHNKYFYSMKKNPNDIIITVDDDVIYPKDLLLKLVNGHNSFPNAVIAGRGHRMRFNELNEPLPYIEWDHECNIYNIPSMDLMATGVGGVLYPPGSMSREVMNTNAIIRLCKYADDIWLKCMQYINRTPVCLISQKKQHPNIISQTQECALYHINKYKHQNDIYLSNVMKEYNIKFTSEGL